MHIKVWGSRGSVPVSGKDFMKYGGDTTCIEIRTNSDDIIIVDAGTGIRRLGNSLIKEGRFTYHFIITHGHWDHLMGFPFFKPLFFENTKIFIHQTPFPRKFIENMFVRVMTPPNFPVRYSNVRAKVFYEEGDPREFTIGTVRVQPIPLSHPNLGNGYKFMENGKQFVFITDNELGYIHQGGVPYEAYSQFMADADLVFHDAEYTPEEYDNQVLWGHSSYVDVVDMAIQARVKRLGLFHLNQDRTDTQVDTIVDDCRQIIAANGSDLDCFAVGADMEFDL